MANRFVQYEDDALQELLEGKTSKNTDKATKTSITLLKTFCDQTNLNTDLEQISAMQLDRVLQRFYAGVRKPNGELYKPTTMKSFPGVHWDSWDQMIIQLSQVFRFYFRVMISISLAGFSAFFKHICETDITLCEI